jgi:PKD repeat protein
MWTMLTDANDAIVRAPDANGFGNALGAPVGFRSGPNGDIFFADIASASVERLRYAAGNRPPVAVPKADKLGGSPPLTVNLDGTGSYDLDDEPITYSWNFADGASSTAAKPSHQYTTAGVFTVTLTVKDQLGATGSATLTVNTRNNPPVLNVTGPVAGTTFAVGATISIRPPPPIPKTGPCPFRRSRTI